MTEKEFMREYPELWDFFVANLSDPRDDDFTEQELVQECTSESPRVASERVLTKLHRLLRADSFPWKDVGHAANRYFTSESQARGWVEEIVRLLQEGLANKE